MVDRHDLFAECLVMALSARGYDCRRVTLPPVGTSLQGVRTQALRQRPDVALVNADLGLLGPETALVHELALEGVAVVVLTDVVDETTWGEHLAAGARVVVPKTETLGAVMSVVRRVSRGEPVLELDERVRLIGLGSDQRTQTRTAMRRLSTLSPQERAVLRSLMAGRSVKDIAEERVVSDGTVRSQVKSILAKLHVNSQLSAVALAHRAGWSPLLEERRAAAGHRLLGTG